MKFTKIMLWALFGLTINSFVIIHDTYKPLPGSQVKFTIDGFMGINVHGSFSELSANIHFNENNLPFSYVTASVTVASVNTGIEKRDQHLKSADFFDVAKYPTITFNSKKIERAGEKYLCTGDLTIKNVVKEISFPFVVQRRGDNFIFSGNFFVDRCEFNVGTKRAGVGNRTRIDFNIETLKVND